MRLPLPRQPVMIGIVIDDLVALEKVAFGLSLDAEGATLADERIDAALELFRGGSGAQPQEVFSQYFIGKVLGH